MACELPAETGVALSRWSCDELAREAIGRGIVERISGVTVWRWLCEDAIRPWSYRSWIFPRDPDFREKAGRILDLYAGRFEGQLLHPGSEQIRCQPGTRAYLDDIRAERHIGQRPGQDLLRQDLPPLVARAQAQMLFVHGADGTAVPR